MKRRKFIASILSLRAIIPFLDPRKRNQVSEENSAKSINRFRLQNGPDLTEAIPTINGMATGISSIDKITDGILAGQLISVFGSLDTACIGLIVNLAFTATLRLHKRVDFVISESTFKDYSDKYFWSLTQKYKDEILKPLLAGEDSDSLPLLRIRKLDLGNPTVSGWKDYLDNLSFDPPELLVIDGIQYLELILDDTNIADHLRMIANQYNIPIVLHAPVSDDDKILLREDFVEKSDMEIRFLPQYCCDYYDGDRYKGKYFLLKTNIVRKHRPNKGFKGLCAEIELQFAEETLSFRRP